MLRWTATCLVTACAISAAVHTEMARRLAARPSLEVATWLDSAALALQGTTARRRTHLASIERVAGFRTDEPVHPLIRAVGLLSITVTDKAGTSIGYQCTATVIFADVALTNRHCLEPAAPTDRLRLQITLTHALPQPETFDLDPAPIESDAGLDFALLRIRPSASGSLPVSLPRQPWRTALVGERLFILHHSRGEPLQLTRAHCRVAPEPPTRSDRLVHTCATLSGSSGALIFAERDYAIVGLHHSIYRDSGDGIASPAPTLVGKSATLMARLR